LAGSGSIRGWGIGEPAVAGWALLLGVLALREGPLSFLCCTAFSARPTNGEPRAWSSFVSEQYPQMKLVLRVNDAAFCRVELNRLVLRPE